jgi:hypothetical protein
MTDNQDVVINIRFSKEQIEVIDRIGDSLIKRGVFGLKREGKVNRSGVVKYLLEREYQNILDMENHEKSS